MARHWGATDDYVDDDTPISEQAIFEDLARVALSRRVLRETGSRELAIYAAITKEPTLEDIIAAHEEFQRDEC